MNCGGCGNQCGTNDICQQGQCVPFSSVVVATTAPGTTQGGALVHGDVFIDGPSLLYTDPGNNSVFSLPLSGGAPTTLATNQAVPLRIVGDGAYAYWSSNEGGAIMRTREDGTGSIEEVSPASSPWGLVVDSTYVYWTDRGSGTLLRAPKSGIGGGAPASLGAIYFADIDFSDDVFWGPGGKIYTSCLTNGDWGPCSATAPGGPLEPIAVNTICASEFSPVGSVGEFVFLTSLTSGYCYVDTSNPSNWAGFLPPNGGSYMSNAVGDPQGCAVIVAMGSVGLLPVGSGVPFPAPTAPGPGPQRFSRAGSRLAFSYVQGQSDGVAVIASPP